MVSTQQEFKELQELKIQIETIDTNLELHLHYSVNRGFSRGF